MKKLMLVLGLIMLCGIGCASMIVPAPKVVLLPEERIFTVNSGTKVHVWLDQKDMGEIEFPYNMKLVYESTLVRQEEMLNDATFKKIKAEQRSSGIMGIVTVVVSALGGAFALWGKNKITKT